VNTPDSTAVGPVVSIIPYSRSDQIDAWFHNSTLDKSQYPHMFHQLITDNDAMGWQQLQLLLPFGVLAIELRHLNTQREQALHTDRDIFIGEYTLTVNHLSPVPQWISNINYIIITLRTEIH
jgi:hypothetical protein